MIRNLIEAVIESKEATIPGRIASEFYELMDVGGAYCWGCDVDIGQQITYTDEHGREQTTTIIRNVPIATNNREIFYAQLGWPVLLRRMSNSKYAVVGLGKSIKLVTDVVYVRFSKGTVSVVSRRTFGYYYRLLTFGELGTIESFGSLPFGAVGVFRASDNSFVRIRA